MSMPARQTVRVDLAERSYDVTVGPGILDEVGAAARRATRQAKRAALLIDDRLPVETIDRAHGSLASAGFDVATVPLHAAETDKSLTQLERVLSVVAETRLERGDPIIALGGGIVGDLAGFAAAVYRRGVPVIQCPTTLLSMVDASVGGKTGANLRTGSGDLLKNLVGAFHQPRAVLADVSTLRSLPKREFVSGLAECVKHGMISGEFGDAGLLDWIDANAEKILALDSDTLTVLVTRNVAVKAAVVAGDEREELPSAAGGRALLNLGHTFGHALETLQILRVPTAPGADHLLHGEAISLGLIAACSLGVSLGVCKHDEGIRIQRLLMRLGLPVKVGGVPENKVVFARMMHDKKSVGGVMRFIVPVGAARSRVVESPQPELVAAALDSIRER
jgi:3-dehydroquinate synthetase